MFIQRSFRQIVTKPLSAVCKIMKCICNRFECCTAVARLCEHVLSLSNKCVLSRHVATAYEAHDQKLQLHCCLAQMRSGSVPARSSFREETKLCKMMKPLQPSFNSTVTKSTYHISKDAHVSHVCLEIAAEGNSCSDLQCQDPVLAGCNQIGPTQRLIRLS